MKTRRSVYKSPVEVKTKKASNLPERDEQEDEVASEAEEEELPFFISTEPEKAINDNEDGKQNKEQVDDQSDNESVASDSNLEEGKPKEEVEETKKIVNEVSQKKKKQKKKKKKSKFVLTEDNVKPKGKVYPKYSEATEKSLEKFLFGSHSLDTSKPVQEDSSDDSDQEVSKPKVKPQWTAISKEQLSSSGSEAEAEVKSDGKRSKKSSLPKSKKRRPAWHDKDDDDTLVKDVTATYKKAIGKHGSKETSTENYANQLRKNFKSMCDTPKWADLENQKKDEDSDDEFFRETTDMLASGKKESLKKGFLEYRKLKDINYETHCEGTVIRCAEFHPSASVGLVAGLNGTASLFQIDGKFNPKMQTVNFENFPIKTAHFTSDGRQFMVGSQHFGHFFVYDMYAGKIVKVPWKEDKEQGSMQKFEVSPVGDLVAFHGRFGNIHIMSSKSRTKLFTLKMNDEVTAVTFSPDGTLLYSHGAGGEVYIWDLKAQECIHRFSDDGCIRGTAISISRNNRYLSCGSDSGVVNVYNRHDLQLNRHPQPEKIVLNLTTPVSCVKFNPSSEILAMSSEVKENAVKMLHLPSMTVFSNFPSFNYNLKRANCMDFSLNGGYFSVGNNRGAANLFRLKHFGNY